ncbi:MAG: cation transporter [Pseudohongiellaceae bacterium]
MTCEKCATKVKKALAAVTGVTDVTVSLDAASVRVFGTANVMDLQAAIVGAGTAWSNRWSPVW